MGTNWCLPISIETKTQTTGSGPSNACECSYWLHAFIKVLNRFLLLKTDILEADAEVEEASLKGNSEGMEEADAAQHVHEDDAEATMTAFDSATDAQIQGATDKTDEDEADKAPTAPGLDPELMVADPPPEETVTEVCVLLLLFLSLAQNCNSQTLGD